MSFLMIPLIFLHDEYIERSKLTELKKNLFECISPHKWGRNNYLSGSNFSGIIFPIPSTLLGGYELYTFISFSLFWPIDSTSFADRYKSGIIRKPLRTEQKRNLTLSFRRI